MCTAGGSHGTHESLQSPSLQVAYRLVSFGSFRVALTVAAATPSAAVDADPVYVDSREGSTGSYASYNSRPEQAIVPVNPEKLG